MPEFNEEVGPEFEEVMAEMDAIKDEILAKERGRLLALMDEFGPDAPLSIAFVELGPLSDADITRGQEIAQMLKDGNVSN